MGPTYNIA